MAKGSLKLVCNGQNTSFWHDKRLGEKALYDTVDFPTPEHLKKARVCYFNDGNGNWCWTQLNLLPKEIMD